MAGPAPVRLDPANSGLPRPDRSARPEPGLVRAAGRWRTRPCPRRTGSGPEAQVVGGTLGGCHDVPHIAQPELTGHHGLDSTTKVASTTSTTSTTSTARTISTAS